MNITGNRKIFFSILFPIITAVIQSGWPDQISSSAWLFFLPAILLSTVLSGPRGALISSLLSAFLTAVIFGIPGSLITPINPVVFFSIIAALLMSYQISTRKHPFAGQLQMSRVNSVKLGNIKNGLTDQNLDLEKPAEHPRKIINSEERFRLILENMQEGVQIIDFDWNYIYLNKYFEKHSLRPNSELLGKNSLQVWPGLANSKLYYLAQKCIDDQVPVEMEYEFEYPDHPSKWFEVSIQPVTDGVLIVSNDISKRKTAEKNLKMSNRLYSTISQINQTIIRTQNRPELYENVTKIVSQYGEFPLAWIGIYDTQSGSVSVAAQNQPLPFDTINLNDSPFDNDIISTVIKTGKIKTISNLQTTPSMEHWVTLSKQLGFNSAASVPLFFNNEIIGSLNLYAGGTEAFESEKEIRLIDEIGLDISFALESIDKETKRTQAEERLKTRERILNLFVENSPAAIAMFDTKMNYLAVSHRFLLDYRLSEDRSFIGRSHYEIFPEISEEIKEIHRRCLSGESIRAENDPFPRADGSLDWVRWEVKPWYDDNEIIGGLILFSEVITENVNINLALQKSEEQMRALVISLDDMIFECDYSYRFTNVWVGDEKRLFKPKNQIIGRTILDIFGMDEGKKFIDAIDHVRASQMSEIIEYDLDMPDGKKWFAARINPIFNKNQESTFMAIMVRDITLRKKAELERQQSERSLRQIIDLVPHFIFAKDLSGKFVLANRSLAEAYGTTVDHLTGTTDADHLKNREEIQFFRDKDIEVVNSGKTLVIPEEKITDATGKVRYMETVKIPFDTLGTNHGILGVSVDITDRKQAEHQIQLQLTRMRMLNEIGQAVTSNLHVQSSLNLLLENVLTQLDVDAAAVLLFNKFTQNLEYSSVRGFRTVRLTETKVALGKGLAGKVGKERKVLHIANLNEIPPEIEENTFAEEDFLEYIGIPLIAKGSLKGVLEIINRYPRNPDTDWMNYLETLANQAALAIDNTQMFEDMQISHQELITAYDATITGWSHALDLRDKETEGHSQRVTSLTLDLAEALNISRDEQTQYRRGALLHDIGKLGIPDSILLKPGKLTDEEWQIMQMHPVYAFQMLSPIGYLRNAIDIPYCHHEKWDGSGYPRRLVAEQIPISARLFAVVDVWDALSSDRPYRKKWEQKDILEYIHQQKGKHFEPRIVDLFTELIHQKSIQGSLDFAE